MALGETAIHTSPSHHYVRLRSFLPIRLSTFHFAWSLLYASSLFPSAHSLSLFCWVSLIAGIIYCMGGLLPAVASFQQCFISCLFFLVSSAHAWIDESEACPNLFLLQSFVGRRFGRILRAELSSNGPADSPSDSPSILCSPQIPRCLRVPLQLKGCTRRPTVSSPTTPSGASVLQVLSAL